MMTVTAMVVVTTTVATTVAIGIKVNPGETRTYVLSRLVENGFPRRARLARQGNHFAQNQKKLLISAEIVLDFFFISIWIPPLVFRRIASLGNPFEPVFVLDFFFFC